MPRPDGPTSHGSGGVARPIRRMRDLGGDDYWRAPDGSPSYARFSSSMSSFFM